MTERVPDTQVHDDLVAVLRTHAEGGERPSRPASAQAADALTAYRSVALHYMADDCIVDCRAVGGPITWGVKGPEITPTELAALRELWRELGMPDELEEILGEEPTDE